MLPLLLCSRTHWRRPGSDPRRNKGSTHFGFRQGKDAENFRADVPRSRCSVKTDDASGQNRSAPVVTDRFGREARLENSPREVRRPRRSRYSVASVESASPPGGSSHLRTRLLDKGSQAFLRAISLRRNFTSISRSNSARPRRRRAALAP
jgi:hypothetical protein